MSEKALSLLAVSGPDMGQPWPPAKTLGSSPARTATDCFAAGQFQVEIYGGPDTRCLPAKKSPAEFRFTVKTASPVISTRSLLRKKATCPGV
jgi:hypothetical protein